MSKMPFAIIFDMDGALFQTETVLVPALHKTFDRLRCEGLWQGDTPVEEYFSDSWRSGFRSMAPVDAGSGRSGAHPGSRMVFG